MTTDDTHEYLLMSNDLPVVSESIGPDDRVYRLLTPALHIAPVNVSQKASPDPKPLVPSAKRVVKLEFI